MEKYNKQAYSSLFEDQMAKQRGSGDQFPVLIRSLLRSLQPPQAALSNGECHAATTVFNCNKSGLTMKLEKSARHREAGSWTGRNFSQLSKQECHPDKILFPNIFRKCVCVSFDLMSINSVLTWTLIRSIFVRRSPWLMFFGILQAETDAKTF